MNNKTRLTGKISYFFFFKFTPNYLRCVVKLIYNSLYSLRRTSRELLFIKKRKKKLGLTRLKIHVLLTAKMTIIFLSLPELLDY